MGKTENQRTIKKTVNIYQHVYLRTKEKCKLLWREKHLMQTSLAEEVKKYEIIVFVCLFICDYKNKDI